MNATRKLIIFDMDKTLIRGNSWYRLNTAMGITPEEDELLYRLGPEKEGIIAYDEWLQILVKIMIQRSHPTRQDIERIVLNYEFVEQAMETVKALQDKGYTVAIISGSFNLIVDDVARKLSIEHGYNNTYLVFDKDDMLENIILTWDDVRYKPLLVQSICRRFGIHPKDVFYVADGDNDIEIFRETIGVVIENTDHHDEPWMRKAKESGETFAQNKAKDEASFRISNICQILDITG